MKWIHTTILHPNRMFLGLSLNEYTVLDWLYKTQTAPQFRKADGYTDISCRQMCQVLGVSMGTTSKLCKRMEERGYLEFYPGNRSLRRVLPSFYENAYRELTQQELSSVHKVNGTKTGVHKVNGSVHKVNGKRSQSELLIEEKKLRKKLRKNTENEFSDDPSPNIEIQEGIFTVNTNSEKEKIPAKKEKEPFKAHVSDEKRKRRETPDKAKKSLPRQMLEAWEEKYTQLNGFPPAFHKKNEVACSKLIRPIAAILRSRGLPDKSEDVLREWGNFQEMVLASGDKWHIERFEPCHLNSQFNTLTSKFKKHHEKQQQPGTFTEKDRDFLRKRYAGYCEKFGEENTISF